MEQNGTLANGNQRQKPAACPRSFLLSHTHMETSFTPSDYMARFMRIGKGDEPQPMEWLGFSLNLLPESVLSKSHSNGNGSNTSKMAQMAPQMANCSNGSMAQMAMAMAPWGMQHILLTPRHHRVPSHLLASAGLLPVGLRGLAAHRLVVPWKRRTEAGGAQHRNGGGGGRREGGGEGSVFSPSFFSCFFFLHPARFVSSLPPPICHFAFKFVASVRFLHPCW